MANEDEISLLDLLVVAAENWMALVIVPLVVAIGVYGWGITQPRAYNATVTLELPSTDLPEQNAFLSEIPLAFYRAAYLERDAVDVSISGSTVSITATANSADTAAELALQIRAELSVPLMEALTEVIDQASEIIDQVSPITAQIEASLAEDPQNITSLLEIQASLAPFNQRIQDATAYISSMQVVPAVESARVGRPPLLYALIAGVGAGFIIVVLLAARQGFRSAAATEQGRQKLSRITDALFLRRTNR